MGKQYDLHLFFGVFRYLHHIVFPCFALYLVVFTNSGLLTYVDFSKTLNSAEETRKKSVALGFDEKLVAIIHVRNSTNLFTPSKQTMMGRTTILTHVVRKFVHIFQNGDDNISIQEVGSRCLSLDGYSMPTSNFALVSNSRGHYH